MERYDLTNRDVWKKLTKRHILSGTLAVLPFDILIHYVFGSNATKVQAKTAAELIKQGKKSGVDEMEIKVDNTKGFKLNVPP